MKRFFIVLLVCALCAGFCLPVFAEEETNDRLLTLVNPWNTIPEDWTVELINIGVKNPSDPIEAFAILDDELFDYQQLGLMGHLVKTEYDEYPGGLTDEKAAEAVRILKGEEK